MDALLIEFDLRTGQRPGGIKNNDSNLLCHSWQDLESLPPREVRIITDDRDVEQYEGKKGITVLRGKNEINAAIDLICKPRYNIANEALFSEHVKQKGINLSDYEGKDEREILKDLMEKKKIIGIRKSIVQKV